MRLEVAGLTDVGLKRAHNEDSLLLLPEQSVFAVADGMGGHASGEVAAKLAIEEVASFYLRTGRDREATWPWRLDGSRTYEENRLLTAVRLANARIHDLARTEARYQRMGTTLVAIAFSSEGALVAHVGDSRAYRWRAGELRQLTEDHSLLNDFLKTRRLTAREIAQFPHKNVILRALGMAAEVDVDLGQDEPRPGDRFLLCSDGLSGLVSDARISRILGGEAAPSVQVRRLIDAALGAGGLDNATALVLAVH